MLSPANIWAKSYSAHNPVNPVNISIYDYPQIKDSVVDNGLIMKVMMHSIIIDDGIQDEIFTPITGKKHQIFSYFPKSEFMSLKIRINIFDYNEYILQEGDSIEIKFNKNIVEITVLNRDSKYYDYNFMKFINETFKEEESLALSEFLHSKQYLEIQYSFMSNLNSNDQNTIMKLFLKAKQQTEFLDEKLDTVKNNNQISDILYRYYKNLLKFSNYSLLVYTEKLDVSQIHEIIYNYKYDNISILNKPYFDFLRVYRDKYILSKVSSPNSKKILKLDYVKAFDFINENNFLNQKDKNVLLTDAMYRIALTASQEDFLNYLHKYEFISKDTVKVSIIKQRMSLIFKPKAGDTKSLQLMDIDDKSFTLDQIKAKHLGKILFVDFWASWCGPCRDAFPSSMKLREQLSGSNIIFIYLSLDATIPPWKKASKLEKLAEYPENYLVVNAKSSVFLKQNNLSDIPRYMIFDKVGKLIYTNAPRVESAEIKPLLLKLSSNSLLK